MLRGIVAVLVLAGGMLLLPERCGADEVILKDGSRIICEVLELGAGKLKVKTVFAKEIIIDWAQVESITTDKDLPIILTNGTKLQGKAIRPAQGGIAVQTKEFQNPIPVDHDQITDINPPLKPAIVFKGFLAAGGSVNDGNTNSRSAAVSGEFEARSDRQRFNIRGSYSYADDNDHVITSRNARGNIKYDFFLSKRLYLFAAAFFENDKFQDLKLRTALSAGPGYQIIDKGDFTEDWLKLLEVSGEVGVGYFNEDFYQADDSSYMTARWAFRVLWPIIPDKIILFHNDEGYPSLQDPNDIYIATEQGIRFNIVKGFFAALQLNWRWDNTPAPGLSRTDTTFLFSVGYNFDTSASS